ncbi:hypothetical protein WAI453_012746 [Rhynchosporium graminicola]
MLSLRARRSRWETSQLLEVEEIDAWRSESDEVAEKKDSSPDDDDGSDAEEKEDKAEHGQHFDPVYSTSEDGGRPFDKKTGGVLLVTVSSSL